MSSTCTHTLIATIVFSDILLNCYTNYFKVNMYECDGVCSENGNTLMELCMLRDNNLMVNFDTTNITLLIEYIYVLVECKFQLFV